MEPLKGMYGRRRTKKQFVVREHVVCVNKVPIQKEGQLPAAPPVVRASIERFTSICESGSLSAANFYRPEAP